MNLNNVILDNDKAINVKNILKDRANATLIRIKEKGVLNEHQSSSNALLILLDGKAIYEEKERTVVLSSPHDVVRIPEKITHRVVGEKDSLLLLIQ